MDIGSGPGDLLRRIKSAYPTVEATGLDIDQNMIEIAQKKSKKDNLSIDYVQGASDDLPFSDASFDHIFSSLLFHHLKVAEKQKTILEVYRILKDGGQVHILDFGRPKNCFTTIGFLGLQLFDGIENVYPHGDGTFVDLLLASPFSHVRLTNRFNTPVGTLYSYQLIK